MVLKLSFTQGNGLKIAKKVSNPYRLAPIILVLCNI